MSVSGPESRRHKQCRAIIPPFIVGLLLFIPVVFPRPLSAQAPVPVPEGQPSVGNITGRVVDSSGVAVPNATVTVIGNGIERKVQSNPDGSFTAQGLPFGSYRVRAAIAGLAITEKIVNIAPGQSVRVTLAAGLVPEGGPTRKPSEPVTTAPHAPVGQVPPPFGACKSNL